MPEEAPDGVPEARAPGSDPRATATAAAAGASEAVTLAAVLDELEDEKIDRKPVGGGSFRPSSSSASIEDVVVAETPDVEGEGDRLMDADEAIKLAVATPAKGEMFARGDTIATPGVDATAGGETLGVGACG